MKWLRLFESFDKPESVTIIGGGISSLYCAWLLKKKYPKMVITILEKESECGGRVKMAKIDGVAVPTGGHFIRVEKDKIVLDLLKDLRIKPKFKKIDIDYNFKKSDVDGMIKKLKSEKSKFNRGDVTFKQFATKVLGEKYKDFVDMMGYTDYQSADFIDTLENYGLEDNVPGYEIAEVDWNEVIEELTNKVGKSNIKLNQEVRKLTKTSTGFVINDKYKSDCVIFATTVNVVKDLLGSKIYSEIKSQPFLKVFAKVKDLSVKTYTVCKSPLRKCIPFGKGVFNIAFSDNSDAKELKSKSKSEFQRLLNFEFPDAKILDQEKFYWEEGTHYYKPLNKKWKSRLEFIKAAQNPEKGIWVVGEMVSLRQGWVEGALDSVTRISLLK